MSDMQAIGSSACPICGKNEPHTHDAAEVREWRETELWVNRSWADFKEMSARVLSGEIKLPLMCGCVDEDGNSPDPECPFCGHPSPDKDQANAD